MSKPPVKSPRGVYYILSESPHEYITSCGDVLKFSSKKKLEVFTKKVKAEKEKRQLHLDKINKLFGWNIKLPNQSILEIEKDIYSSREW